MHLRFPTLLMLLGLAACAPKVAIHVPASPAVALNTATIKVSASERRCRGLADEVAVRVNAVPGMRVDPQSDSTLTIYACTTNALTERDTTRAGTTALAALRSDQGELVYLLGSARQRTTPKAAASRGMQQAMNEQVASDLVEQFAPLPSVVRRRIHANPQDGSARALHNRAVRAEQRGELTLALAFAREAHAIRPRPQRARYIAELARRLSRTVDAR